MAHVKGPDPLEDESTAEAVQDESTGEEGIAAAGNLYGNTGKLLHPIKPNEWNA